jgi:hypothetical protein
MDKTRIIAAITGQLRALLAAGTQAARATTAAATDQDSRAENKYDTRNLEASYLARGQAFRVAELQQALAEYDSLRPRGFAPGAAAAEGALVTVQGPGGAFHCFLGPAGGGVEVVVDEVEITVVTRSSPLGAALTGRKSGERFSLQQGRPPAMQIVSVQ